MLTLDSIPLRVEGVLSRTVRNQPDNRLEAVLVIPSSNRINVFDELGARIWDLMDGARSVREIALAIYAEYEIDEATAEKDTLEFVELLLERQVIRISENPVG